MNLQDAFPSYSLRNHFFVKRPFVFISFITLACLLLVSIPFINVYSQEEEVLTLAKAIEIALQKNPNVMAMVKAVQQAEYLSAAASKEWLPIITTDYSVTGLEKKPTMTFNKGDLEGWEITEDKVSIPLSDRTSFLWRTHLKMPLYTGNAIQYQESIAKLGVDVSKMRFFEAQADLVQEVTMSYLNVLRLQQCFEVATQNVARFREHERITERYYRVGLVAKNSLLDIKARRANAQQELIDLRKNLTIAKMILNVSMGVDMSTQFCLQPIVFLKRTQHVLEECYEQAVKNNPTLVAFTYVKKRAEKVRELEKTETRPKVNLDVSFSKHGRTATVKGDDYITNNILMGMVTFDWTVFDWLKTRDRTKARDKELEMIIENHRFTQAKVFLDIKEAYLNMEAARRKLKVVERQVSYTKENYRIAKRRYEEQVGRSTEVNDALVLYRQAEFNYYDVRHEYNVCVTKLERIIGMNIPQEYAASDKKRRYVYG